MDQPEDIGRYVTNLPSFSIGTSHEYMFWKFLCSDLAGYGTLERARFTCSPLAGVAKKCLIWRQS
jgi:hypothetical protein